MPIFWREKGTKPWREGWITGRQGNKIKIGDYNGAPWGIWYDRKDIEIEERKS
jgi:hypothetical protein